MSANGTALANLEIMIKEDKPQIKQACLLILIDFVGHS